MLYVLYTIFFLSCIVLVGSVLLQPGKTDAGALFTSNVSSNAFGPRGTATVLAKITIAAAIVFMVSALMISMPALTGNVSVLSTAAETTETPAETNTNAGGSNVNSSVPADQNGGATQPAESNTSASADANVGTPANSASHENK